MPIKYKPIFRAGDLWRHKRHSTHCVNWVNVAITGDSADNGSFLTDDSLEYLDLSHLSIRPTSNGLSIEEEIKENPLGVLPYQ